MDDQGGAAKRPGRKEKIPGQPKTGTLTFRVRGNMREQLRASATSRGLSLSEEVERRLDLSLDMAMDPFKTIALRMIVERWRMVDAMRQFVDIDDPDIYASQAEKAVRDALSISFVPSIAKEMTGDRLKEFYSGSRSAERISELLGKHGANPEAIADGVANDGLDVGLFASVLAEPNPPKQTKTEREAENKAAAKRKSEAEEKGWSLSPEEMDKQFGPPGNNAGQTSEPKVSAVKK